LIRPATADDARALAELEVRAWRWAYVDFVAEEDMITVADRVEHWEGEDLSGAFVAEVEGRVAGLVVVDAGESLLRGLHVEPAAQGAGLGATLHDVGLDELRRAGADEAVLWVFEANGHARGFYERRGWAADGATTVVLDAPQLRYRKTLER
jgi:GNAT superfamily N-acetyltransferase